MTPETLTHLGFTIYPTYDAAASIAVSNSQDDDEAFYNPVKVARGWAVEVILIETGERIFLL